MMNAEQLSRVGEKLVKRCGSRDPFEIARQLGINVMLCENFGSLKGMYRVIKRNRFIFLNNSLDENMLRIVCAHELGHDQLHRNMAKTTPIHEFMLYDMKSKPEYEANIVAAEILMDSDEVLRYIYEYGYTAEQIASAMSTDINLVALKVAHLATLGYNLHALEHKSNTFITVCAFQLFSRNRSWAFIHLIHKCLQGIRFSRKKQAILIGRVTAKHTTHRIAEQALDVPLHVRLAHGHILVLHFRGQLVL